MAKKMPSRRERQNAVISLFTFPAFIISFYLMMKGIIGLAGVIVTLFIALIIGSWTARYVPDMRKKENKNKNPYTGLLKKPQRRSLPKHPHLRKLHLQLLPVKQQENITFVLMT